MRLVREFYTLDTSMFESTRYILDDCITWMAYHEAKFDGDRHYVDVKYSDGSEQRVFNLDFIEFV